MMEMKEFQEKLKQILEKAEAGGKNLKQEEILQVFGMNQLSTQQLQSLYEYLRIQGIRIEGVDLQKLDIEKEIGDRDTGKDEQEKELPLSPEDQACLQEYEAYQKSLPKEREGEREELLRELSQGNPAVLERLSQLYLPEIMQYARELRKENLFLEDLIQEGNMALLTLSREEIPQNQADFWVRKQLRTGIESWVREQTEQKLQDEYLVEKVRKLEAAIKELSDEEENKFSVEELSAFLDMEEEEIRAVLSLTSEGAEDGKEA
ncbi:MAG: hypothetical protein KH828_12615 [Clostridiales bacterium]|nr:hypothetical protein [Clostridiales bacterium]